MAYTKEQELRNLIRDTLFACKCGTKSAPAADTLMAIPEIKAAPAMYEALEKAIEVVYISIERGVPGSSECLRQLRWALALARGE